MEHHAENPISLASHQTTRRNILKGAAWSFPAITLLAATPLATASVKGITLSWVTHNQKTFSILNDVDQTAVSKKDIDLPASLAIRTAGQTVNDLGTISIVTQPASFDSAPHGYGFGLYSFDNIQVGGNATDYGPNDNYQFPVTTWAWQGYQFDMQPNSAKNIPLEFGLSGETTNPSNASSGIDFYFQVTVTFNGGGVFQTASSITVPRGADLL